MSQTVYVPKKRVIKQANAKINSESALLRSEAGNMAALSIMGGENLCPMSKALREKFEPAFNADFSNIRISRGKIPSEFGVEAFTRGTNIHLDSSAGDDVLGHELAHVVQQASARVASGGFPVVKNLSLEHEADVMGERVAAGGQVRSGDIITPMSSASAPIQAKSKREKEQEKMAKAAEKAGGIDKLRAKRPWEITKEELEANRFNPNQDDDLQAQLNDIDRAADPESAVRAFHQYSGNAQGQLLRQDDVSTWDMGGDKTKLNLIKTRLKNMSRMIRDYPELRGEIGNITEETEEGTSMSASHTFGPSGKSDIS
ncbi:MAG: DUF4157 domain-containing protein [Desulfosporosinus sp.]|jgi:hypothetical protein